MSSKIIDARPAGPFNQVVTVKSGNGIYRKKPCRGCPWVKANDGAFPAEAFIHSAPTSYDMSERIFGCHESGSKNPAICAGFLLHGADHNMSVRLKIIRGVIKPDEVSDGGRDMHEDYKEMAVANGVPVEHPALRFCR